MTIGLGVIRSSVHKHADDNLCHVLCRFASSRGPYTTLKGGGRRGGGALHFVAVPRLLRGSGFKREAQLTVAMGDEVE